MTHKPMNKKLPQSTPGPVAPPVYRPQPTLKVLQKKPKLQPQLPGSVRKPIAPPVYRPLAVQRKEAPRTRAPFPTTVRADAIGVVQRAEDDWSKYDDVWWPKAYRLNGPYKNLKVWETWGQASRYMAFNSHQLQILIAANKKRNGGVLKSDADNDPYPILAETVGEDNSVECDHVINGKLKGGANHWWNARLVSRKLNNSMEREVGAHAK